MTEKKKRKRKPQHLWFAYMNLGGGLHHDTPIKLTWSKESECYLSDYMEDGDYDCTEPGWRASDRIVEFASEDKKEVELLLTVLTRKTLLFLQFQEHLLA